MVGELDGRVSAWKRTPERDVRPRHDHPMSRPAETLFIAGLVLRQRALGQWRAGATKPCRLWDGGSVSVGMNS